MEACARFRRLFPARCGHRLLSARLCCHPGGCQHRDCHCRRTWPCWSLHITPYHTSSHRRVRRIPATIANILLAMLWHALGTLGALVCLTCSSVGEDSSLPAPLLLPPPGADGAALSRAAAIAASQSGGGERTVDATRQCPEVSRKHRMILNNAMLRGSEDLPAIRLISVGQTVWWQACRFSQACAAARVRPELVCLCICT